jgi:pilus assembly protein CpaB
VLIAAGGLFLLQRLGGDGGAGEEGGEGTGQGPEEEIPPTPTPPPTLEVIVAARDIPRGKPLTLDDVTTLAWPILDEAPPPLGVLFVDELGGGAGLDQVVGRIARSDITTGMPILDLMITPGDQPSNLADVGSDAALLIPGGNVAITIPITRLSSVAYSLRPGDHIDILMSFRFVDVDEEFQSVLPNTGLLLTDNIDLAAVGLQQVQYLIGAEERGVFGTSLLVSPSGFSVSEQAEGAEGSSSTEISTIQVPRQTTQLVVDNAIVLRMGEFPLIDLYQPIVVTAVPQATPIPEGEVTPGAEGQATEAPTPTPSIPIPDVITLIMSRQDALVLKYATEVGADIDLVLRSAVDDEIADVTTDPVTLDYIINFRNVTPPEKLPIALDPQITLLLDFADMDARMSAAGTTP